MRISDWGSDVCSSDLRLKGADGSRAFDRESLFLRYGSLSRGDGEGRGLPEPADPEGELNRLRYGLRGHNAFAFTVELPHHVHSGIAGRNRSEEHTSELQSLMRISYAVFCLKKKNKTKRTTNSE